MVNNIGFIGNNNRSYNGITVSYGGYIKCGTNVGVSGFGNGFFSMNGGFMDTNSTCATNNTIGYYSNNGSYIDSQYAISNGNTTYGFCSGSGSFMNCDYTTAKGQTNDYYSFDASLIRFYQRGNNNSPVINPAINTIGNNNSIIAG